MFDIPPGQSGGESWTGPLGWSTEIEVEGMFAGPGQPLRPFGFQTELTVVARGWTWSGDVNGQQAALGEGDACFGSNTLGLMFGTDCGVSADSLFTPARWQHGHTRYSPPGGPNEGVWYVSARTTSMELRTQINRMLRSDGDVYAMVGDSVLVDRCDGEPQSIYSANTGCGSGNEFGTLVNFVWNHEGEHMSWALTEAGKPVNDLHARLDSLATVGFGAEGDLETEVENLYSNIHQRIWDAAQCAHTQVDSFLIWYSDGSGWGPAYIHVEHC